MNTQRLVPPCRPRGLAFLVALPLLLANTVQADPYDESATTGGLEKVCRNFSINTSAVLSAKCNKFESADLIVLVDASIDLSSEIDGSCMGGLSIEVSETAVTLKAECTVGGDKVADAEENLNDLIEWNVSRGEFRKKSGTEIGPEPRMG